MVGHDAKLIQTCYDLKGSTFGRITHVDPEQQGKTGLKVLKDQNMIETKSKLNLEKSQKQRILNILESDTSFLMRFKMIDYSMLLFVVKVADSKVLGEAEDMMTLVFNRVNSMYEEAKLDL